MNWNKQENIEWLNKQEDWLFETKKITEKKIRSIAQNKYWHRIICKYVWDFMGEDNIGRHIALKQTFSLKTTTNLEKDEFARMCKLVIKYFYERYNFIIPLPRNAKDDENLYWSLGF